MLEIEQYQHCKGHFESIERKLDSLDVAIRGNGKPGVYVRLDRLEAVIKMQSRMFWVVAVAAAAAISSKFIF